MDAIKRTKMLLFINHRCSNHFIRSDFDFFQLKISRKFEKFQVF